MECDTTKIYQQSWFSCHLILAPEEEKNKQQPNEEKKKKNKPKPTTELLSAYLTGNTSKDIETNSANQPKKKGENYNISMKILQLQDTQ